MGSKVVEAEAAEVVVVAAPWSCEYDVEMVVVTDKDAQTAWTGRVTEEEVRSFRSRK